MSRLLWEHRFEAVMIEKVIAAFLFWLLPAIVRLCAIDISEIAISHTTTFEINSPANKTLYFLYNKDKHSAFITILKNNMQGCILNVLGGGLLGIGTLFNLLLNGFCFADVCCRTYKLGMSITDIFALTLPHSFELIGFWISGGIGLYIAWNIILFMYTDKMPTFKFYKNIGINLLIIFIIILSAAYIETYVSINMLT